VWNEKKVHGLEAMLRDLAKRGPNLSIVSTVDHGPEWRAVVMYHARTLVNPPGVGPSLAGPVVVGIRFNEDFLDRAPHPMEIATILEPQFVFHPNCSPFGALCLATAGATEELTIELVVHQTFAALVFNMDKVNTRFGEIANGAAAVYVRENAQRFPLTRRGLFEDLEDDLRAGTKFPSLTI
jgi:hypothetical protein